MTSRRKFVKRLGGTALAGLAIGGIRTAGGRTEKLEATASPPKDPRAYGQRSRFVTSGRLGRSSTAFPSLSPLQDSEGIITPAALHFTVGVPGSGPWEIDPQKQRLMIHGMVGRPLIFTMDELKRLPSVSRIHFLECAGNSYLRLPFRQNPVTVQHTHGMTGCSEWTGVLLSVLLREAGVQKAASWVVAEGSDPDKHWRSIPVEKAMDDVLVAYAQNGEPVRPEQGYPLRLVVPGWEGNINVKWLRRIKAVDQPYMTRQETTKYADVRPDGKGRWFNFEMAAKSVITFPSGGQQLPGRGFYEIRGLAWSGRGTVRKVEVSTDGGRTWTDAELQSPVLRIAHTRFRFAWKWDGQEALLQSRCTDDLGDTQPTMDEFAKLWGVSKDYWLSTSNFIHHCNAIQPWKVTADGRVRNAIFS
ncbi:MAG: sulfite dehydrogenase [Acidobacteria bacterium]|nr:sulfite dehydrogenase [Acidobacteriota bacterium]